MKELQWKELFILYFKFDFFIKIQNQGIKYTIYFSFIFYTTNNRNIFIYGSYIFNYN